MEIIDLKGKEVFKEDRGMANIINDDNLMVNQICLEPGQSVPSHLANSEVTLQVLQGEGTVSAGDEKALLRPGQLLRIPFKTTMQVRNDAQNRLVFLVFKTPHPDKMG